MHAKKSLRYQVNIRILISSICILILSGSMMIWQARKAVNDEVNSSINLALQLVELELSQVPQAPQTQLTETYWLNQLSLLEETRHLNIQLKKHTGEIINTHHDTPQFKHNNKPPQWFIRLVKQDYPEVRHQLTAYDGKPLELIIKADPLDEITEVWHESTGVFISIIFFTLMAFLAINLVFNKTLKSISDIVNHLKLIETGQYHNKLPEFSTREYDSIAKAINHMTLILNQTQQENRALARHTLEIQEDERQRLAQELHDELGQSLTAIKVMAVTIGQGKNDNEAIANSIIDISEHLMTVVRTMMHQLHPLVLSELGLKATLEDLMNHWSQRNPELSLTFHCADAIDELEQKVSIQIFRVIQECMTNIIRHAQATRVNIELSIINDNPKKLHLQVSDNGKGCDTHTASLGFGLLGMKERIKTLGGELHFKSEPDMGLTVTSFIPIS